MRRAILYFVFSAFLISSLARAGEPLKVEVISADDSKVRVELTIPDILVEEKLAGGERYQMLTIPGGGWLTQVGNPQLPLFCRFVALPPSSEVRLEVVETEKKTLSGSYRIFPFQKPPVRGEESESDVFQLNQDTYSRDRNFPGKLAEAGEISIIRDLRVAPIKFFPVQVNPAIGEVTVYNRLVVDIYIEGTGENPLRNPKNELTRSFLETFQTTVLNFDEISLGKDLVDGSVLIITYDDFYSQVQPLAESKYRRGLPTHLVNLSSIGTTNTQIYDYIYNAYHTWPDPPEYVILVGDVQQIPTNDGLTCITDHKYATVDGSDYFADLHIGRLSVQTQTEAAYVVSKILNYRNDPFTTEEAWFRQGMTISGSSNVDDDNAQRCGQLMVDYGNFTYFDSLWASLGTNTVTQITSGLNQGRSWTVYFGHGSATSWSSTLPGFTNAHIDALDNSELLPAIFSAACSNGKFDYDGDCFAERWIKTGSPDDPTGAVAICAPTEASAFFYSDTLGRGTFKAYFADSLFNFTPAVNSGKMYMYTYFPEEPGGITEREMQMYTTFGDPELDPWTAFPDSLNVTHPDFIQLEEGTFTVLVQLNDQSVKNALVCLIKGTEVYQSARTGSDGQITLYPLPQTTGGMDLIVSAHNAYQYEAIVQVISTTGPYVTYAGYNIDDDDLGESQGNGDGDLDAGETVELPVMLVNLGDSTAEQVTAILSTTHSSVTITDDYEEYGDILAGDSIICLDDFGFYISPQTPDGEIITFDLDITAQNPERYWSYPYLKIAAHAPVLTCISYIVDDIGGDEDGRPDPGELCAIEITMQNTGSQGATEIQAELISEDPYVTVISANSTFPDIPPEETGVGYSSYQFQIEDNCPEGHTAGLILQISAAGPYSTDDTLQVIVGRIPILFVDDDGGDVYESYFISPLDSVGLIYDVWTYQAKGSPPDSVLQLYQAVIWNTGDDYGTLTNPKTLTLTDQERLMNFLDNGGKLLLSSQDFLLDNNPNVFITDYLHLAGHSDDQAILSVAGVTNDTISGGMAFDLDYPFFNFSDFLVPGANTAGIFYETSKEATSYRAGFQLDQYLRTETDASLVNYCALRYPASGPSDYRVVFLAFPFEAVPQNGIYPNNSYTLLRRIIGWFGLGQAPPQILHGDANGDGTIDLADAIYLLNYLFKDGATPDLMDAGDVNCDGFINLGDVIYLLNYLFKDGDPPPC